jgi:[protein-PII] uridylyltransferase
MNTQTPLLPDANELPLLPTVESDDGRGLDLDYLRRITREYIERLRTRLQTSHSQGASGQEVVALCTTQIDKLIAYLFAAASYNYALRYPRLHQRCTVIAQGGYAREELNPYSDIDLLFLYHWKITPYVETVCETIFYSLLDTDFTVGHAVRSIRECVRLANRNLHVKTALLDARYLSGDKRLYHDLTVALEKEIIPKSSTHFIAEKLQESKERYRKHGGSIYLLEPYLKEGRGGLRDLHTALWLAKIKFKVKDLRELVHKGVISEGMLAEVITAQDFLWQVRNALHLLTKFHQDHLTFAHQEQVAPALGFADVTNFMHHYYRYAATAYDFCQAIAERCLETPRPYSFTGRPHGRDIREGVRIVGDTLVVTGSELFVRKPINLLTIFHDTQRHGVSLGSGTRQLIRDHLALLPDGASAEVRQALFAILSWKKRVYDALYEMHALGVLGHLIPEFARLRWLTQRDPYHVYTVDEHSLNGIAELERLRAGEYKQDHPLLTQVMREVDKVAILFLAMLLHDVGKGYGSGHAQRGATTVQEIARRWGLDEDEASEWYTLVHLHLRMSYLAQRRDLSDDALIIDFARTVGTPAVLKKLYLLTFADMRAVGSGVWNTWKGGLLDELYRRTLEVFEKGVWVEEAHEERVARVKERLRRTLLDSPSTTVLDDGELGWIEEFLDSMPANYFHVTPEESVPQHLKLLSRFARQELELDAEGFLTALEHFAEREYSEFTVVTRDRPGLFAMLAGVLAANGLNIASGRITTSYRGMALDVFRLSHLDRQELAMTPERWERVYAGLRVVLRGECRVEDVVRTARPPAFLSKRLVRLPTEVAIDNVTSRAYTVIDVSAPDHLGLLFTITHCLFSSGLVIHLAKVTTNVDQVLDVFYVTDTADKKISQERFPEIKEALLARLAAED